MGIGIRLAIVLLEILYPSHALFAQGTNGKLKISHLTGDLYIFTTYKSLNGNQFPLNGMYLNTSKGVVLFDTPWDSTQFQPLLDSIKRKHNANVVMCIATHSHDDRTGGLEYLKQKGIKTYTTRQTDEICVRHHEKRAEFLFRGDTIFRIGQHSFQVYCPGAGHTPDNIVIWFDSDRVLYGGCLVKSVEANSLGYVTDANLNEWSKSIRKIQHRFKRPNYIVPGHQDWSNTKSLEHTLKLLSQNK